MSQKPEMVGGDGLPCKKKRKDVALPCAFYIDRMSNIEHFSGTVS
jgi:hypothetical protein